MNKEYIEREKAVGIAHGYCRQLERPVDKQFFCGLGEQKGGDGEP